MLTVAATRAQTLLGREIEVERARRGPCRFCEQPFGFVRSAAGAKAKSPVVIWTAAAGLLHVLTAAVLKAHQNSYNSSCQHD